MTGTSSANFSPRYVTDTHALVWYLQGDSRLSPTVKQIMDAAQSGHTRIIVSAIVLAEMYWIHQKRPLTTAFSTIYSSLEQNPGFRFVPLDAAHILDFAQDAAVNEMHDRIIVGLARRLQAPLLSRDVNITQAGIVTCIW